MEIFIEVSHKNREINNNVKIFELILYSINMIQNFMDFQYHFFYMSITKFVPRKCVI